MPLTWQHSRAVVFEIMCWHLICAILQRHCRTNEQFTNVSANVGSPLPIDLGPAGDQVYLVLYGSNLGTVSSSSVTVGGVAAELAYAGPLAPANGVAQFNIGIPRTLAGAGAVDVVVTINGKASNPVVVTIK